MGYGGSGQGTTYFQDKPRGIACLFNSCVCAHACACAYARTRVHTHTHIHTQVCNEKQHIFKLQNQSTVFSPQPLREEGKEIGHSQPPRRHPKALDPYCHVL